MSEFLGWSVYFSVVSSRMASQITFAYPPELMLCAMPATILITTHTQISINEQHIRHDPHSGGRGYLIQQFAYTPLKHTTLSHQISRFGVHHSATMSNVCSPNRTSAMIHGGPFVGDQPNPNTAGRAIETHQIQLHSSASSSAVSLPLSFVVKCLLPSLCGIATIANHPVLLSANKRYTIEGIPNAPNRLAVYCVTYWVCSRSGLPGFSSLVAYRTYFTRSAQQSSHGNRPPRRQPNLIGYF